MKGMQTLLGLSARLALILAGIYALISLGMIIGEVTGGVDLLPKSLRQARLWVLALGIVFSIIGLFCLNQTARRAARLALVIALSALAIQILLVLILAGLVAGGKQNYY